MTSDVVAPVVSGARLSFDPAMLAPIVETMIDAQAVSLALRRQRHLLPPVQTTAVGKGSRARPGR
jgi:hypothetical protein